MHGASPEPMPSYKLLGDSPYFAEKDALDFHKLAEGLVTLLRGVGESTPLTIGIQAPWGMGKSSFMHQLKRQLDEEPKRFKTVWFNAWTFDGENILEGLIKTVLDQLDTGILRRKLRDEKFTKALRVVAGITAKWFGVDKLVNDLWNAVNIDPRARNQLQELLVDTMSEWIKKAPAGIPERTIVVFIDDLDRCSPESVFQVFEAIKLYLDSRGLVFVIGMDTDIVSEAILEQKKYSKRITSEQYVEKIIQISYNIPPTTSEQIIKLFETYTLDSHTTELFDNDSAQIIIDRSNANPRRIKRFINVFILEQLLNPESRQLDPKLLIKIIMLGMYYRSFCRLFDPGAELNLITEFLEYQDSRQFLEGQASLSSIKNPELDNTFKRYDLSSPVSYETADKAIGVLNGRVPEEFVALAANSAFIKLLKTIEDQDRRAVSHHIKRVGEAVARETEEGRRGVADHEEALNLHGLRILWVDDNPKRNEPSVKNIDSSGAHVLQVTSTEDAISALQREQGFYNLLISDVERGKRRTAGFKDLPIIRSEGPYEGPVIFYPRVVRQEDRKQAKSLNAFITKSTTEFYQFLSTTAEAEQSEAFVNSFSQFDTKQFKSSLKEKMYSLPETERKAKNLLERMTPEQAIEELVVSGVGKVMAEAAVKTASTQKSE